jgi:hypothetical protein
LSDGDRYYIDANEDWPVYSPRLMARQIQRSRRGVTGVEIPDEFIDRYEKAAEEWTAVQGELGEYAEEQDKRWEAYREEHGCKKLRRNAFTGYGPATRCYALPKDDTGTCPFEKEHVKDE